MTGLRGRIRRLFHLGLWSPDPEQGVDWEIEHHIAERADELEGAGLSRPEALKEARRQFGNVEAVRREMAAGDRGEARRRRLSVWLDTVRQDVRYGVAFRTGGDPTRLFKAVRAAVHELAPDQPVREVVLADTAYGRAIELPRFLAVLVGGLGAFALVLVAVGLFGVLACDVAQRGREIGVRMAIGASSEAIRKDVVGRGLLLAGTGATIGIVAAIAMSRLMAGLLFDL